MVISNQDSRGGGPIKLVIFKGGGGGEMDPLSPLCIWACTVSPSFLFTGKGEGRGSSAELSPWWPVFVNLFHVILNLPGQRGKSLLLCYSSIDLLTLSLHAICCLLITFAKSLGLI